MNEQRDGTWRGRGVSLLWHPEALHAVAAADAVMTLRALFRLRGRWPEVLPHGAGRTLVAVGLEGVLDALPLDDAVTWLERDLAPLVRSFQSEYDLDGALVLWLPSGDKRVRLAPASTELSWHGHGGAVPLGRALFSGAESSLQRIVLGSGAAAGYYLPRMS